jgi:hypothetical protein
MKGLLWRLSEDAAMAIIETGQDNASMDRHL